MINTFWKATVHIPNNQICMLPIGPELHHMAFLSFLEQKKRKEGTTWLPSLVYTRTFIECLQKPQVLHLLTSNFLKKMRKGHRINLWRYHLIIWGYSRFLKTHKSTDNFENLCLRLLNQVSQYKNGIYYTLVTLEAHKFTTRQSSSVVWKDTSPFCTSWKVHITFDSSEDPRILTNDWNNMIILDRYELLSTMVVILQTLGEIVHCNSAKNNVPKFRFSTNFNWFGFVDGSADTEFDLKLDCNWLINQQAING